MSNTWTTLLDMVYPVGSVYVSTKSDSPASKFGGTWMQVEDSFVAAKGDSYITGIAASYSGNKAITIDQLPSHDHNSGSARYLYDNGWSVMGIDYALPSFGGSGSNLNSPFWWQLIKSQGGGKTLLLTTSLRTCGTELHKRLHCSEGSDE